MGTMKTRQGHAMNRALRFRIVEMMAKHPHMTRVEMAGKLGINRRTLSDYLTDEVVEAVGKAREVVLQPSLEDVDRAMLEQACRGNVAAARLVYMRTAQKGHAGPMPTLEDLETELNKLKQLEEDGHGEGADDVAALDADAAGRAD